MLTEHILFVSFYMFVYDTTTYSTNAKGKRAGTASAITPRNGDTDKFCAYDA